MAAAPQGQTMPGPGGHLDWIVHLLKMRTQVKAMIAH